MKYQKCSIFEGIEGEDRLLEIRRYLIILFQKDHNIRQKAWLEKNKFEALKMPLWSLKKYYSTLKQ